MFGLFAARCPVGPRERVWIERGIAQLVDIVGLEWLRRTPVLTLDDLQEVVSVEPISAAHLAERMAPHFPWPVDGIQWLEEPDLTGATTAGYFPGKPPMGIVPHQPAQTAETRTAIVARCLCEHALTSREEFRSLLHTSAAAVDLLGILAGVGLFGANAALADGSASGCGTGSRAPSGPAFMPSRQSGYALAVRCFLCNETSADWTSQLRLDAREPFELGLKFLRKNRPVVWDDSRDTLRSFRNPPDVADVARHLHDRQPAVQINALFDVQGYRLSDESLYREIGNLVHDNSDDVREETIRTIAQLNADSSELGEALIILCEDRTPRVRSLAALTLGDVSHPPGAAVDTLRELTGDAEPIVSAAAAEALLSFPDEIADDRPRLFRVLRQQLARCNYESVDRFVRRLNSTVADAGSIIEQEFAGADNETWREILLQSITSAGTGEAD